MTERYYPPDYRKNEVSAIIKALDQGFCVSVIGPPSVGKSNLLKFLDQERLALRPIRTVPGCSTRRAPSTRGGSCAVSIDPNALLPALPDDKGDIAAGAWPGFELLTHRTTITPQLYPAFSPPHTRRRDTDLLRRDRAAARALRERASRSDRF